MAIEHHRPFAPIGGRSPDIQEEAVFIRRRLVVALTARLQGQGAELKSVTNARPGLKWWCSLETIRSRNGSGVRDALESRQAVALCSANAAVRGVDFDELRLGGISKGVAPRKRSRSGKNERTSSNKFAPGKSLRRTITNRVHVFPFPVIAPEPALKVNSSSRSSRRRRPQCRPQHILA